MSVIATFSVPTADFHLERLLDAHPDVHVRLEPIVPMGEGLAPFLWITGAPSSEVLGELQSGGDIEEMAVVEQMGEETLVTIEWEAGANGLMAAFADSRGAVLEAAGTEDGWTFEVRFPNYETLSTFYTNCVEAGLSLDLSSVHNPSESRYSPRYGLTPEQYETLVTAVEMGYFDIPRGATLVDLGEELNISDSAASQRLRRGLASLVTSTLLTEFPAGDDRGDTEGT